MKNAIDILKQATELVEISLSKEIKFFHGNTITVVNYIQQLKAMKDVYPAIIVFTEGITERQNDYVIEFTIPKIAICTTTVENATEKQRLESNFANIIYPIFEAFQIELRKINSTYNLIINRTDIPFFIENSNKNTFYQLVDGCLIKNLSMKVEKTGCL